MSAPKELWELVTRGTKETRELKEEAATFYAENKRLLGEVERLNIGLTIAGTTRENLHSTINELQKKLVAAELECEKLKGYMLKDVQVTELLHRRHGEIVALTQERDRAIAAHCLADRERQEALERVQELKARCDALEIGWDRKISERWHIDPEQRDRRDRLDTAFHAAKARPTESEAGTGWVKFRYPADDAALIEAAVSLAAIDAFIAAEKP